MKKFEIWCEGFVATGQRGLAHKVGEAEGENFTQAVENYIEANPNCGIESNSRSMYVSEEAYIDRTSRFNIWGCNLFSNEEKARKTFG